MREFFLHKHPSVQVAHSGRELLYGLGHKTSVHLPTHKTVAPWSNIATVPATILDSTLGDPNSESNQRMRWCRTMRNGLPGCRDDCRMRMQNKSYRFLAKHMKPLGCRHGKLHPGILVCIALCTRLSCPQWTYDGKKSCEHSCPVLASHSISAEIGPGAKPEPSLLSVASFSGLNCTMLPTVLARKERVSGLTVIALRNPVLNAPSF